MFTKVAFVLKNKSSEKMKIQAKSIVKVLDKLGFNIVPHDQKGYPPVAYRNQECLNLYSNELSGFLKSNSVSILKTALMHEGVKLKSVKVIHEEVYDITHSQALEKLNLEFKSKMRKTLLDYFITSDECNYRYYSPTNWKVPFQTFDEQIGRYAFFEFLNALVEELVKEKLLIPKPNLSESAYRCRTLNEFKRREKILL